jgi:hypothetical protein
MGLGGVGLVTGGLFTLLALQDDKDADAHCRADDPGVCDQKGVNLAESARGKANVATIATGIGGALLVTGFILVLTAPSGDSDEARQPLPGLDVAAGFGRDSGFVSLKGAF